MKVKIRQNTFETNSSSMHTVVLTNKTSYVTEEDIKKTFSSHHGLRSFVDGSKKKYYLNVETDSFGREFRILSDWNEKLVYALASLGTFDGVNTLAEVVKEYLGENCLGLSIKAYSGMYSDPIEGIKEDVPSYSEDSAYDLFGSIDHQSYGTLDNAISALHEPTLKDALKKIIFSNEVVIVVDGDETDGFRELLNSGFFEAGYFTKILHTTYDRKDWKIESVEFVDLNKSDDDDDYREDPDQYSI